jgi:hypothetical protein
LGSQHHTYKNKVLNQKGLYGGELNRIIAFKKSKKKGGITSTLNNTFYNEMRFPNIYQIINSMPTCPIDKFKNNVTS